MDPRPGRLKTRSMTTAPRKVLASSMPRMEMTGTAPLRNAVEEEGFGEAGAERAGGAQVIAAQHVERGGAHIAQQRGAHDEADGQCRQQHAHGRLAEIGPALERKAARGQPAQIDGKERDEEDADPEDGDAMPSWEMTEMAVPYHRSERTPARMPSGTASASAMRKPKRVRAG